MHIKITRNTVLATPRSHIIIIFIKVFPLNQKNFNIFDLKIIIINKNSKSRVFYFTQKNV